MGRGCHPRCKRRWRRRKQRRRLRAMTRRRLGHPCHPIKLTTKDSCNANGPNGFMEPRYRDAGVRGAWSASRHGRLPLIVDVTFIRSKATGHTTSTDPSRSHTLRASAVGLSRPTEGGSRRRGGAEPLLLGEQPLVDVDGLSTIDTLPLHGKQEQAAAEQARAIRPSS